jgi:hypothetical protein
MCFEHDEMACSVPCTREAPFIVMGAWSRNTLEIIGALLGERVSSDSIVTEDMISVIMLGMYMGYEGVVDSLIPTLLTRLKQMNDDRVREILNLQVPLTDETKAKLDVLRHVTTKLR